MVFKLQNFLSQLFNIVVQTGSYLRHAACFQRKGNIFNGIGYFQNSLLKMAQDTCFIKLFVQLLVIVIGRHDLLKEVHRIYKYQKQKAALGSRFSDNLTGFK
ncbi:hypothetical protein D9M68_460850 [compost metagenome]